MPGNGHHTNNRHGIERRPENGKMNFAKIYEHWRVIIPMYKLKTVPGH